MDSIQLVFQINVPFPALFPLKHLYNPPYNLLFIMFITVFHYKM